MRKQASPRRTNIEALVAHPVRCAQSHQCPEAFKQMTWHLLCKATPFEAFIQLIFQRASNVACSRETLGCLQAPLPAGAARDHRARSLVCPDVPLMLKCLQAAASILSDGASPPSSASSGHTCCGCKTKSSGPASPCSSAVSHLSRQALPPDMPALTCKVTPAEPSTTRFAVPSGKTGVQSILLKALMACRSWLGTAW